MKEPTSYIHAGEKSDALVSMAGQWEDGPLAVDIPAVVRRPRQDGLAPAQVMLIDGGAFLGTIIADASGIWSFTPTLADGAHSIIAGETDAVGNTGPPRPTSP